MVAFTATQIPNIDGRKYPAELAGKLYPKGIPIYAEEELAGADPRSTTSSRWSSPTPTCRYEYVMHKAALVNAAGADFTLHGRPSRRWSRAPSRSSRCAPCAPAAGKSQTIAQDRSSMLREAGMKVVAIRHPMPYGDLAKQAVQRFATIADLEKHECTIEEREEYEPHIVDGNVIYAGVDYEAILREAEKEADVILWDGGNNDISLLQARPVRSPSPTRTGPGHELVYYPGEANLRMADVIVINKVDTRRPSRHRGRAGQRARASTRRPMVIVGASPVTVDEPEADQGQARAGGRGRPDAHARRDEVRRRHGGRQAVRRRARSSTRGRTPWARSRRRSRSTRTSACCCRPWATASSRSTSWRRPSTPSGATLVVIGTPIDLRRIIKIKKPTVRVRYELQEIGHPTLQDILSERGFI